MCSTKNAIENSTMFPLVRGYLDDYAYVNVNYERKSLDKSIGNCVSPVKKLPHSERIIRIMSHKD